MDFQVRRTQIIKKEVLGVISLANLSPYNTYHFGLSEAWQNYVHQILTTKDSKLFEMEQDDSQLIFRLTSPQPQESLNPFNYYLHPNKIDQQTIPFRLEFFLKKGDLRLKISCHEEKKKYFQYLVMKLTFTKEVNQLSLQSSIPGQWIKNDFHIIFSQEELLSGQILPRIQLLDSQSSFQSVICMGKLNTSYHGDLPLEI